MRASLGKGSRKKSVPGPPSSAPRGTWKYGFVGGGSSAQSTPGQVDSPIGGGVPVVEGAEVQTWFSHSRPPKQSAFDMHVPPTSPLPSGWHSALSPSGSHRSPETQSPSLLQVEPAAPPPSATVVG